MKVFDCTDMPDEVNEAFFEETDNADGIGNDIYVSWDLSGFWRDIDGYTENEKMVDSWLIEKGAVIEDQEVIIKRWW